MKDLTAHEQELRAADGGQLARFLVGLVNLETFFESHPGALVPELRTLSFRMPDGDDSERQARVDEIAAMLGVHAQWRRGVYTAARDFGSITVEAHFTPAVVNAETIQHALRGGEIPVAA